jgi:flagellar motility protein MotE (MotC chaperone)
MKSFRNFRLIPLVLAAIICLAGLKIVGLVVNGGFIFNDRNVSRPSAGSSEKSSWARDMFNFPAGLGSGADSLDVTGSIEGKKEEGVKSEKASETKSETKSEMKPEMKSEGKSEASKSELKADAKPGPYDPVVVMPNQSRPVPASERAILERLQERRQELDARAREIDIRENLLKSAEKRIEDKVEEMKATEVRIGTATEQKTQVDATRFKGIVTMYESMKPKDAAKIFDRLDMSVLIEVASQIAPRKMSDIVGLMQPEAAERLTVEMARRAGGDKTAAANDLPKIEGRPAADGNN